MKPMRITYIVLLACLLIATVMLKASALRSDKHPTSFSLEDERPSSGTVLFDVRSSPYVRYLRSAAGFDYDGRKWSLQKDVRVDQYLNTSPDKVEVITPDMKDISRSYHDFGRDILNGATTIGDSQYLELPDNITDRVKSLAVDITRDTATPFEKAKAIEMYLRIRYIYKLDYIPAPQDWEPNDWFLFESNQGMCGDFNSAFVVLARASGIPARLAAGYYIPPSNEESQSVHSYSVHAWSEVGFERLGWIAFEATPS